MSTLLIAAMGISSFTAVFAENETPKTSSVWNYNLIDQGTEDLYSEFPFSINKLMRQEMKMDLSFLYLKNLEKCDMIEISVTDTDDDSVILSKTLTSEDSSVYLEDVPNNKTYRISVDETIGNDSNQYLGYIETKYVTADFPINITLGSNIIENNSGEELSNLKYKKVGERPVCNHEEDEPCSDECRLSNFIHKISLNDKDTFYDTLDENCYYELQVTSSSGTSSKVNQGFISTYPGGEDDGIFTRGFVFKKSLEPTSSPARAPKHRAASATYIGKENFPDAVEYDRFENVMMDFNNKLGYCFKFIAPETDDYVIETVGNLDLMIEVYKANNDDKLSSLRPSTIKSGGTGNNPRTEYGYLVDPDDGYLPDILYIEVSMETDIRGLAAFRIVKKENNISSKDTEPNFRDIVQEACDNGNYSDTTITANIEYTGDVDIFGYNVDSGKGYMSLYLEKKTNPELLAKTFYVDGRTDGFDTGWYAEDISTSSTQPGFVEFSKGRYYVEIHRRNIPTHEEAGYYGKKAAFQYTFNLYHPKRADKYDLASATGNNNLPSTATQLIRDTDEPNILYAEDATLHKSDSDFYTFTTENYVTSAHILLSQKTCPYLYDISLYDDDDITMLSENTWRAEKILATGELNRTGRGNIIDINGLKPNHKYYVRVTRPNSTSYDTYYSYYTEVVLTQMLPTVTLNSNVTLNHTVGNNISSLDNFLNTVANNMTCTINDTALSTDEILNDLHLYYNNSELTASTVNSLAAGTYSLTAKYIDVTATGGNITLTVIAATTPSNAVTIELLDPEPVPLEVLDWVATAKMIANIRLRKEGKDINEEDLISAAISYGYSNYKTERGDIIDTINMATYFYTFGNKCEGSYFIDIETTTNPENTLYNSIKTGKAIIMQMVSIEDETDMSEARYLLLLGVDKGTHQLKIYDPINDIEEWYNTSDFLNGTYGENGNLIFSKRIIEGVKYNG